MSKTWVAASAYVRCTRHAGISRNGLPPCAAAVRSKAVKTVVTGPDGKMARTARTTGGGSHEEACSARRGADRASGRGAGHDYGDARLSRVADLFAQFPRVRKEGERGREGCVRDPGPRRTRGDSDDGAAARGARRRRRHGLYAVRVLRRAGAGVRRCVGFDDRWTHRTQERRHGPPESDPPEARRGL